MSFKSIAAALLLGVTALIAACGGGSSVVPPATLTSISVGPPEASLAAGLTSQYSATGIYSDGSKQDISSTVTWASSTPASATISNAGLATAVDAGTTTITATSGGISGTTTLTVTAATLVSIGVTPAIPSIAAGTTLQFAATGVFTDNSKQDLTATVTWSSGTAGVATISNATGTKGLATGVAPGSSVVTAAMGSVSGTTTLNVTAATLVSIGITPATASLASGTTQQFVATGVYSDDSTQVLTAKVTWTSSAPTIATIGNATGTFGIATAVAVGTTSITASVGSITAPAVTLNVTPATLASIGVTPALPSITNGTTQQFTATGVYTDNSTQDLTTKVTWSSSAPTIATISNAAGFDGQATALAVGTTTITATLGSMTSPGVTLTVTHGALTSIAVTPATPSIAKGLTQQFTATGTYADGTHQDVTATATWNSGTPSIATISNAAGSSGLAMGEGIGSTSITATLGAVTSPGVTLNVTAATLVSIAVTPAAPSVAKGLTQQFTATGTYTDASTLDLTTSATWHSATTTIATISNANPTKGLATSLAVGTTNITAAFGGLTSLAVPLTVTAATVVSVAVTPAAPTILVNTEQQFVAKATYTDATVVDVTTTATWNSATPATAQISNANGSNGLATGMGVGTSVITATFGGATSPDVTLTVLAAATQYTYVSDFQNGKVWEYGVTTAGALLPLTTPNIPTGVNPSAMAVDAIGHHLYVTNEAPGSVSQYTIGTNGELTVIGADATAGAQPSGITIDPTAHYAYVANFNNGGAGSVSQYTIAGNGALQPMAPATVNAGNGTSAIALDPNGGYAYVANYTDGTIWVFAVGGGGVLGANPVSTTTLTGTTTTQPNSMVIDPTGRYLYVADYGNQKIGQFAINSGTGALTPLGTPYISQYARTISLHGGYVYASDYAGDSVAVFQIGNNGDLGNAVQTYHFAGGTGPNYIGFSQTGNFAYVADRKVGGTISQFTVSGTDGHITVQTPPTVPMPQGSLPARPVPLYIVTASAY